MINNKIFVQIVSYRDKECKHTIDDLFLNAKYPDQIFVGLNWQYAEEDNDEPFYKKDYAKNIRMLKYHYLEAKGVCWARSLTQTLHKDEMYTLSIDAHMRFVQDWDQTLITMLEKLQNDGYKKPIISHYPPDYTLDGKYGTVVKKMAPFLKEDDNIFIFRRTGHQLDQSLEPQLSACLAAGFNFTLSESIKEVPYDEHLYFLGEEINLAVRLWTHGYDIFNPSKIIIYHLYKNKTQDDGEIKQNRKINLNQNDNDMKARNIISKQRVKHLLGTSHSNDPNIVKDLEKYGLGKERNIYQFELFSGINFKNLSKKAFTRTSIFSSMMIPLGRDYEEKLLNKLSTEEKFFTLDSNLLKFIKTSNIKSILHIRCSNYSHDLRKLKRIKYLGIDFNKDIILNNRISSRLEHNIDFFNMNYISTPLPSMELSIIDLNIFDIPENILKQLFNNLQTSSSKYIAIYDEKNLLFDAPYYFPEPNLIIPQKNKKILIWHSIDLSIYLQCLDSNASLLRKKLFTVIEEYMEEFDDEFAEIIYKYLPIQSHSQVKEKILNSKISHFLNKYPSKKYFILNLIKIRFRILDSDSKEFCPFINEQNSLEAMSLICDYCELKNEHLQNMR